MGSHQKREIAPTRCLHARNRSCANDYPYCLSRTRIASAVDALHRRQSTQIWSPAIAFSVKSPHQQHGAPTDAHQTRRGPLIPHLLMSCSATYSQAPTSSTESSPSRMQGATMFGKASVKPPWIRQGCLRAFPCADTPLMGPRRGAKVANTHTGTPGVVAGRTAACGRGAGGAGTVGHRGAHTGGRGLANRRT